MYQNFVWYFKEYFDIWVEIVGMIWPRNFQIALYQNLCDPPQGYVYKTHNWLNIHATHELTQGNLRPSSIDSRVRVFLLWINCYHIFFIRRKCKGHQKLTLELTWLWLMNFTSLCLYQGIRSKYNCQPYWMVLRMSCNWLFPKHCILWWPYLLKENKLVKMVHKRDINRGYFSSCLEAIAMSNQK